MTDLDSKIISLNEEVCARSFALTKEYSAQNRRTASYFFACILGLQWIGAVITALLVSPETWHGYQSVTHVHVWAALILGGVIAICPIMLAIKAPEKALTRHVIATAQMLFSALIIHLSGGRIETHFHVFGSLAFLTMFRDWKILITATVVVASDHFLRGIFWPESVYGVIAASNWRSVEHALWVLFEVSGLVVICKKLESEVISMADAQAKLELTKHIIEEQVKARTEDLLIAHDDLKKARDNAIALAKVKSEFLANMSHEIRTPLNGVIGTLDIVMETDVNHEQFDLLRTGYNSAKSLLTIINDILDVSKIESGKFSLSPVDVDLDRFLQDCERMMNSLVSERELTLVITKKESVPRFICIDETKLRQVLINLIGNSVKFTQKGGGIVMLVDAVNLDEKRVELQFSVSDCGKGIAKQKYDLIFEAFSQEDNTIARKHGGTGLGLTISKAIVELMGGKLSVRSRENVGSAFTFEVIAERRDQGVFQKAEPVQPKKYLANPEKAQILLAEDNPVNQKITVKLLENKGFKVKVVENGALALEALEQYKYDLVLMDVQMPVMDGIEAIKQIRSRNEDWSKIPIIALTAHALSGDKESVLSVGADGYVTKPIDKHHFFETILSFTQN